MAEDKPVTPLTSKIHKGPKKPQPYTKSMGRGWSNAGVGKDMLKALREWNKK